MSRKELLACLDVATGDILWKKQIRKDFMGRSSGWAFSEGLLVDGPIYGGPGHNGGSPFCLDVRTGKLDWKERGAGFGSAGLVYAHSHLYCRYEDNVLALVEATPKGCHLGSQFQVGTGNPTYRERNSATNRKLPGDLDTGWPPRRRAWAALHSCQE